MKKKKLFKKISREDMIKGGKFLLVLVIVYAVLSIAVNYFIPLQWIEFIEGKSVSIILNALGMKNEIIFKEPVQLNFSAFSIQVSFLCTGLMELYILTAGIVATAGIEWKKKFFGFLGAIAAVFIFNVFRISASVILISVLSLPAAEFAHDILFRISLFLVIAGYYFAWYYINTRKQ